MSDPRQPSLLFDEIQTRSNQLINASADYFNEGTVLKAMNFAQANLYGIAARFDSGFGLRAYDFNLAGSTEFYEIPANVVIKRLEWQLDGTKIPFLPFTHRAANLRNIYPYNMGAYIKGRRLGITPVPSGALAVRLWYVGASPDMHYGTLASATSTTAVLDATPDFGITSSSDDFYVDAEIVTTGGTGSGQQEYITDYVGSTRTASVAWGATPDATTTYEILSSLAPQDMELLMLDTIRRMCAIDTESAKAWGAMYGADRDQLYNEFRRAYSKPQFSER